MASTAQHLVDAKRPVAFVADGESWASSIGLSATETLSICHWFRWVGDRCINIGTIMIYMYIIVLYLYTKILVRYSMSTYIYIKYTYVHTLYVPAFQQSSCIFVGKTPRLKFRFCSKVPLYAAVAALPRKFFCAMVCSSHGLTTKQRLEHVS